MPFTHLSHGAKHLRIASDDGHHFVFTIEKDETGKRRIVAAPDRDGEGRPDSDSQLVEEARQFASVCARDFGLR